MRGGAGIPRHIHLGWLRLEKLRSPTTPPPHLGCDRNITIYQGHQHAVAGFYGLDRHLAGTGAIIWNILETGSLLGGAHCGLISCIRRHIHKHKASWSAVAGSSVAVTAGIASHASWVCPFKAQTLPLELTILGFHQQTCGLCSVL